MEHRPFWPLALIRAFESLPASLSSVLSKNVNCIIVGRILCLFHSWTCEHVKELEQNWDCRRFVNFSATDKDQLFLLSILVRDTHSIFPPCWANTSAFVPPAGSESLFLTLSCDYNGICFKCFFQLLCFWIWLLSLAAHGAQLGIAPLKTKQNARARAAGSSITSIRILELSKKTLLMSCAYTDFMNIFIWWYWTEHTWPQRVSWQFASLKGAL